MSLGRAKQRMIAFESGQSQDAFVGTCFQIMNSRSPQSSRRHLAVNVVARLLASFLDGLRKLVWTGSQGEKGSISKHGGPPANASTLMKTTRPQLHSDARVADAVPFSQILHASVAINYTKLMKQL